MVIALKLIIYKYDTAIIYCNRKVLINITSILKILLLKLKLHEKHILYGQKFKEDSARFVV